MAELIDKWEVVSKLITLQNNYNFFKNEWDVERLYREIAKLEINIGKTPGLEVVRCKDCTEWGGVPFGNVCRRWSAPLAGMKNCTGPDDVEMCRHAEMAEEVYKLTLEGCALAAAIHAELPVTQDQFDVFWKEFMRLAARDGYIMEQEVDGNMTTQG